MSRKENTKVVADDGDVRITVEFAGRVKLSKERRDRVREAVSDGCWDGVISPGLIDGLNAVPRLTGPAE